MINFEIKIDHSFIFSKCSLYNVSRKLSQGTGIENSWKANHEKYIRQERQYILRKSQKNTINFVITMMK